MIRARESKSAPVGVVGKVLRILEALDASPAGLQLREIAAQTNVNKSTAYRFVAHLENEGYLLRDGAGAYVVGPKLARLGSGIAYHATLRKLSQPVALSLSSETKETVNLGVLDGHELLYLQVIESPHSFRMASQPGMRRPLTCTALGKALLAFLPDERREELLPLLTFERVTPRTISNLARFRKELARVAQQGYAIDDQETDMGARCVAAPIMDEGGDVAAAISVSGPITRISRDRIHAYALATKRAARAISAQLGRQR
ncbi:MAG TPA: IclR family transcriptional regulator [Candidatus Bathyarchaeia archaeon]|nr:IclR family transcriptional regulator [Candidatus Bathyarchaeia archaeon]